MNVEARTLEEYYPNRNKEIPNESLEGWGRKYNGSVIRYKNRILFAYRRFNPDHKRSDIGIAILDDNMNVVSSHGIKLSYHTHKEHYEDPRLFLFKDRLWLATSMITDYKVRPWISIQKAFRLTEDLTSYDNEIAPSVGANGRAQEKNWQFFDYDGRLMFVYAPKRNIVVEVNEDTGEVLNQWKGEPVQWDYGTFSGGTPPIKYGDVYLSFFHGYSPCVPSPHYRRYYYGAYTFEAKPPFKILGITPFPICMASGKNRWYPNPGFFGWEPQVVFPCGSYFDEETNQIVLSIGVNDCYNSIVTISSEELSRSLVSPNEVDSKFQYFLAEDLRESNIPTLLSKVQSRVLRVGKYGNISSVKTLDYVTIEYMNNRDNQFFPITYDQYKHYITHGTPKDLMIRLKGDSTAKPRRKYGFRN